jgi:predicted Zn finger-like uncharacterized protein
MIVTCTSCKTRFRVSGDQIGPKGARIRCSRCKTIFVVAPDAPGGVPADPPDSPRSPEPQRPPPLPRAGAAAVPSDRDVPLADPFDLSPPDHSPRLDPFAPSAPRSAVSSFCVAPSSSSGTLVDPFGPLEAAAPAKSEDPFGAGWDPFGVAEPAPGTARDDSMPALSPGCGTTDLTELLGDGARAKPPVDLGSLALEEHEAPPPKVFCRPDEGPELDFGLGLPDFLGSPGHGHDVPFMALAAPAAASPDPEPPRIDERTDVVPIASTGAGAPSTAPAGTPPAEPVPSPSSLARSGRLAAVLANSLSLALLIAVAVVLFLTWRGGLVAKLRGALALGTPAPLVEASAVTGGLYDTAAGSAVLVVRGQIGARGTVTGPVRVRVELVDGARVVAAATGFAGAAATAEQVYGAGTPEEAAALRRALDARAARAVAAGASVPFLVVFPPPTPDPQGLRVRVDAEPAPATALTGG